MEWIIDKGQSMQWTIGKNKKLIIDDGKYLTIESGSFPGCCPESWDMEVTVSWLLSFTEIRNLIKTF